MSRIWRTRERSKEEIVEEHQIEIVEPLESAEASDQVQVTES